MDLAPAIGLIVLASVAASACTALLAFHAWGPAGRRSRLAVQARLGRLADTSHAVQTRLEPYAGLRSEHYVLRRGPAFSRWRHAEHERRRLVAGLRGWTFPAELPPGLPWHRRAVFALRSAWGFGTGGVRLAWIAMRLRLYAEPAFAAAELALAGLQAVPEGVRAECQAALGDVVPRIRDGLRAERGHGIVVDDLEAQLDAVEGCLRALCVQLAPERGAEPAEYDSHVLAFEDCARLLAVLQAGLDEVHGARLKLGGTRGEAAQAFERMQDAVAGLPSGDGFRPLLENAARLLAEADQANARRDFGAMQAALIDARSLSVLGARLAGAQPDVDFLRGQEPSSLLARPIRGLVTRFQQGLAHACEPGAAARFRDLDEELRGIQADARRLRSEHETQAAVLARTATDAWLALAGRVRALQEIARLNGYTGLGRYRALEQQRNAVQDSPVLLSEFIQNVQALAQEVGDLKTRLRVRRDRSAAAARVLQRQAERASQWRVEWHCLSGDVQSLLARADEAALLLDGLRQIDNLPLLEKRLDRVEQLGAEGDQAARDLEALRKALAAQHREATREAAGLRKKAEKAAQWAQAWRCLGAKARAFARYADEAERQVAAATSTQSRADAESRMKGVQEIARQAGEAMESLNGVHALLGAAQAAARAGIAAAERRASEARELAGDWHCLRPYVEDISARAQRIAAGYPVALDKEEVGDVVQALERLRDGAGEQEQVMRTFTAARAEIDAHAQAAEAALKEIDDALAAIAAWAGEWACLGGGPERVRDTGARAHACVATARQQAAQRDAIETLQGIRRSREHVAGVLATVRKEYEELHAWQTRLAGRIAEIEKGVAAAETTAMKDWRCLPEALARIKREIDAARAQTAAASRKRWRWEVRGVLRDLERRAGKIEAMQRDVAGDLAALNADRRWIAGYLRTLRGLPAEWRGDDKADRARQMALVEQGLQAARAQTGLRDARRAVSGARKIAERHCERLPREVRQAISAG